MRSIGEGTRHCVLVLESKSFIGLVAPHRSHKHHHKKCGVKYLLEVRRLLTDHLFSFCLFQIVFEGTRGRGYTGDIALDDVQFREGSCEHNGFVTF